jgi:hypothetical protein
LKWCGKAADGRRIAEPVNSIAEAVNSIGKLVNSIAEPMNSIAEAAGSKVGIAIRPKLRRRNRRFTLVRTTRAITVLRLVRIVLR